jgi:nicotinamidase/pyrazinamidase
VVVPNRDCALALDGAQQIVVEKQHVDSFTARNLARLLETLAADRFVVYGVVTEICVLFAARGLLTYGKPVTIVIDAVAALNAEAADRALAEICAAGGTLARSSEIA